MSFDEVTERFRWVTASAIDAETQTYLIEISQKFDQLETLEPLLSRLAAPQRAGQS